MDVPTLLFIDPVCPRPYDPSNINISTGVGGTEQTMVTLAEGLAATGKFNVVVEQHNRQEGDIYEGRATYTHYRSTRDARWVIVLRNPASMVDARKRFNNSKIYLYSHDLADRNLGISYQSGVFKDSGCSANITVSQWHKFQTIEVLKNFGYCGEFKTQFIYNPLGEDVKRTGEAYFKNKLLWMAAPHKGLDRAYEVFKYLVKLNPDFRLYVTNPGYADNKYADSEISGRVVVLGTLPHEEVIQHLKTSLCLFYPNSFFPETFGKIMAESNEVGTPVITSPIGASKEVLDSHPGQIVDCRSTEAIVKRVLKWHDGERPIVRGNPKFKLSNVITEWDKLLNDIR